MMGMETAFPDGKGFEKTYAECIEKEPPASDAVKKAYDGLQGAFYKYLEVLREQEFRYAYECGYKEALKRGTKGMGAGKPIRY